MLYIEIIAVCSQIHTKHKLNVCTESEVLHLLTTRLKGLIIHSGFGKLEAFAAVNIVRQIVLPVKEIGWLEMAVVAKHG